MLHVHKTPAYTPVLKRFFPVLLTKQVDAYFPFINTTWKDLNYDDRGRYVIVIFIFLGALLVVVTIGDKTEVTYYEVNTMIHAILEIWLERYFGEY
jgi:hypothetical protein